MTDEDARLAKLLEINRVLMLPRLAELETADGLELAEFAAEFGLRGMFRGDTVEEMRAKLCAYVRSLAGEEPSAESLAAIPELSPDAVFLGLGPEAPRMSRQAFATKLRDTYREGREAGKLELTAAIEELATHWEKFAPRVVGVRVESAARGLETLQRLAAATRRECADELRALLKAAKE